MDASAFWNVIGTYNSTTVYYQAAMLAFLLIAAYIGFRYKQAFVLKLALGLINLFIAFGFFLRFGTEAIQKYFAFPLYLFTGLLFIFEGIKNRDDKPEKPGIIQLIFFALYMLYPLVSFLLGGTFPKMVTHIMPCPVVTISLVLYSLYSKKNRLLLFLLTVWGLTGVKAIIFAAYEDLILLAAGIYGVVLLIGEFRHNKHSAGAGE